MEEKQLILCNESRRPFDWFLGGHQASVLRPTWPCWRRNHRRLSVGELQANLALCLQRGALSGRLNIVTWPVETRHSEIGRLADGIAVWVMSEGVRHWMLTARLC